MTDNEARTIAVGQWLGTGCQIRSLARFAYGWRATDSTGCTYRQDEYPDGLKTWDTPTDGRTYTPRTPWPADREGVDADDELDEAPA